MAKNLNGVTVRYCDSVQQKNAEWSRYTYIPLGKTRVIHGDHASSSECDHEMRIMPQMKNCLAPKDLSLSLEIGENSVMF